MEPVADIVTEMQTVAKAAAVAELDIFLERKTEPETTNVPWELEGLEDEDAAEEAVQAYSYDTDMSIDCPF